MPERELSSIHRIAPALECGFPSTGIVGSASQCTIAVAHSPSSNFRLVSQISSKFFKNLSFLTGVFLRANW
jgi:hypothetical protein